jgi:hypothetical protein
MFVRWELWMALLDRCMQRERWVHNVKLFETTLDMSVVESPSHLRCASQHTDTHVYLIVQEFVLLCSYSSSTSIHTWVCTHSGECADIPQLYHW